MQLSDLSLPHQPQVIIKKGERFFFSLIMLFLLVVPGKRVTRGQTGSRPVVLMVDNGLTDKGIDFRDVFAPLKRGRVGSNTAKPGEKIHTLGKGVKKPKSSKFSIT